MIAALVDNPEILEANLLRSPDVRSRAIAVERLVDAPSASAGYNRFLQNAPSDLRYCCLIHQDVYLPAGWFDRLDQQIALIEETDKDWAALGVWGIVRAGELCGRVWCSGSDLEYRGNVAAPAKVLSVDEIVIILNPKHGLRFDEGLPGFHLFATDIINEARKRGLNSYAIDAPVIHNSRPNPQVFDAAFFAAYRYMQRKWREQLPLLTCVTPVTRFGMPLLKRWTKREILRRVRGAPTHTRHPNPELIAQRLGYAGSGDAGK